MAIVELVAAEDPPGPQPRRRARWLLALLAVGAFVVALAGIARLVPPPTDLELGAKLARFAEEKDGYDTLFVGSSLVHRNIDPHRFDAAVRAGGRESRSFNLGFGWMVGPEVRHLVGQVAALRPRRLRWVFVDIERLGLHAEEANVRSARFVGWHDGSSTALAIQMALAAPDATPRERLVAASMHWRALVHRSVNAGSLRHRLEPLWLGGARSRAARAARTAESIRAAVGPRGDGFHSLEYDAAHLTGEPLARLAERQADLERRRAEYVQKLRQRQRKARTTPPLTSAERDLIGDIAHRVEAMGARLILFNGATVDLRPDVSAAALAEGLVAYRLDLGDPRRFPELFLPEERYDWDHLKDAGVERFSSRLAEQFLLATATEAGR